MRRLHASLALAVSGLALSFCAGGSGAPHDPEAPAPTVPEGCLTFDLAADRVEAWTVESALVTGQVRLNGSPHGGDDLRFEDLSTGVVTTVDDDDIVDGVYTVRLQRGTYRVSVLDGVPVIVHDAVTLEADGVLDVDYVQVRVRGRLTGDGVAAPDHTTSYATRRGHILFEGAQTFSTSVDDQSAAYVQDLPPGTYDVSFQPYEPRCDAEPVSLLPCARVTLATGLALTQDTSELDFDLSVVELRGQVTVNGEEVSGDGALSFVRDGFATPPIALRGRPATFAVGLSPGTYDVLYVDGDGRRFPANPFVVARGVDVTADATLDLDLEVGFVEAPLTVRGAHHDSADGALLRFSDGTGAGWYDLSPSDLTGDVDVALTPGRWNVTYVPDVDACADGEAAPWPCVEGRLGEVTVVAGQTTPASWDLTPVTISGRAVVNGAPVEGAAAMIEWTPEGGAPWFVPVDDGRYSVRVLPGAYAVHYLGAEVCGDLPCGDQPLLDRYEATGDATLDLPVTSVTLSGVVTYPGLDPQEPVGASRQTWFHSARASGHGDISRYDNTFEESLSPGVYQVLVTPWGTCEPTDPACLTASLTVCR